jgi:hypothetical protein
MFAITVLTSLGLRFRLLYASLMAPGSKLFLAVCFWENLDTVNPPLARLKAKAAASRGAYTVNSLIERFIQFGLGVKVRAISETSGSSGIMEKRFRESGRILTSEIPKRFFHEL